MVAKKCKHWHAPAQRLPETRVHNDMPYGCLDEHSIALVENSCIALRAHDPNAGQLCVSVQHIEIEGSRRIQDLAWVDKANNLDQRGPVSMRPPYLRSGAHTSQ